VNPPGVTMNRIPAVAAAGKRLHVAMIAPPYFDIPPTAYGGIEGVVADLVDALIDRDHEVTLIGAGRHRTRAHRFLATYQRQPADHLGESIPEVVHAAQVARLLEDLDADVVHDHTLAGPLLARGRVAPTVVTVHGPATGEPGTYYSALGSTVGLVAISDAQRATAPGLPWAATVHNAIRTDTFPFRAEKDEFALFLGRFHPDKAPHLAVEAARAAKLPIVLAGKCAEPAERAYFTREVEPRLGPDTTMFGIADAAAKRDLLSRAACLVFPICWDEPFGLVVIEAMACGTPVVALRRGAAPELILPGQTGVIVDHPSELAGAIDEARRLDPWICRKHVQQNFTTDLMAAAYEAVYRDALAVSVEPASIPAGCTFDPLDGDGLQVSPKRPANPGRHVAR
jgi:glycosyltransferase involved in cell wall biosynthesis